MIIAAIGSEKNKLEFEPKINKTIHSILWFSKNELIPTADVYFIFESNIENIIETIEQSKVVFINAVEFLNENFQPNIIRANFWNSFIQNNSFELAENATLKNKAEKILDELKISFLWVPDIIGLITPRVISMIINEAYFGLEDRISSKKDIDIAMKLGTNYPYGPFEWSEIIGLKNILSLLETLSKQDSKYNVSTLLKEEANKH